MPEPVTELRAGRDLDALVAERVMGWHLVHARIGDHWVGATRRDPTWEAEAFTPSTSIAAAFVVVEKMEAEGWDWAMASNIDAMTWHWDVRMFGPHLRGVIVMAETLSLAICRAALMAVSPNHLQASNSPLAGPTAHGSTETP